MAGYIGSALVVTWIQSAATTTLTGDHKSFTYTPSINLVDETAGADANKNYLAGVKDGNATYNAVLQSGSGPLMVAFKLLEDPTPTPRGWGGMKHLPKSEQIFDTWVLS